MWYLSHVHMEVESCLLHGDGDLDLNPSTEGGLGIVLLRDGTTWAPFSGAPVQTHLYLPAVLCD